MDYGTLNGTTGSLGTLAEKVNTVKENCTNKVLAQTADQWPNVQDYLQEVIDKLDEAKANYPSQYGAPMEAIASKYGG